MTKTTKWFLAASVAMAVIASAFFAVGGRTGLTLLWIQYAVREESASYRDVEWQRGPSSPSAPAAARPPNIVLIVADDLGHNDVSLNGGLAGGRLKTPHIDRIANEGVNLATAYSGSPTCAPSRAAIMTGRYPTRYGYEFTPTAKNFMRVVTQLRRSESQLHHSIYFPEREQGQPPLESLGLPTNEITLARVLRSAGYHTAHVGKWHLGDAPQFRPTAHGFNESLSLPYGAAMFLPEDDPNVVNAASKIDPLDRFIWAAHPWGVRFNDGELFKPNKYLTDYFTDQALKIIDHNRHRPFFLYLAYNAPHTPLQATREDYEALAEIEDHSVRVYAAMIRSLDRNIGRILEALDQADLSNDTLVIFTSDNGGTHTIGIKGINAPFRGWKATHFEGGIRVPMYMRWPNGLPQGRFDAPASHLDIFSTAAAAADTAVPSDRIIDGVNLLPYLRGEAAGRPHQSL
jgi:arylsulfatase A-like enzyme